MSRSSLVRAFLSSALGTGLSRVLGLGRELAIANALGAGMVTDAFVMAWTFPGMLRRFVADEGLTGALVPAIARAESEDGNAEAARLAGRLLAALILLGTALSLGGILTAPWLVDAVADGFVGEKRDLTVRMTQVVFPFVVFVSLVSWCEGLLNHRGHFFVPKVAPGLVSAAMVAGVLWPGTETALDKGMALCWAVLVGGVLHLLVCVPPLVRHWGALRPRFDGWGGPRFRSVWREMGKVAVIGLMAQVNVIVLRTIASYLPEGSVTWYWNATRLVDFAQGIIAVGVGSALLPVVAKAVADNDWDRFRDAFVGSVRLAAALLLPSAAFVLVLSVPSVALLYRHGAYTFADVEQTASALRLLVLYMLSLAGIQIVKKPFFALEKRNALIGVGAVGVALTGGLGLGLAPTYGVDGLALALSISTAAQLVLYVALLARLAEGRLGLADLTSPLARMALATVPAAAFGWFMGGFGAWEQGPTASNAGVLAIAAVGGGALYAGASVALGVDEVRKIARRVLGRFGGRS